MQAIYGKKQAPLPKFSNPNNCVLTLYRYLQGHSDLVRLEAIGMSRNKKRNANSQLFSRNNLEEREKLSFVLFTEPFKS